MLEVLANSLAAVMLPFTGYYSIKKITNSNTNLNIKTTSLLILSSIISISLLAIKDTGTYTIIKKLIL